MFKKIILYIFILFILFGCGNEPPAISFPIYHILIYQSDIFGISKDTIFLSIYFVLYDDNGIEDISSVKITHIETEYSWIIPAENLSSTTWNDKTYYGFPFLEYDNGNSILLGDYLIEVKDKSDNLSEAIINVEMEGQKNKIYNVPEIKYKLNLVDNKKELKIEGDNYYSAEIKFMDNPSLFNNGRKKFKKNEKIILNNNKPLSNASISVRINKDENESIIYYLKLFNY